MPRRGQGVIKVLLLLLSGNHLFLKRLLEEIDQSFCFPITAIAFLFFLAGKLRLLPAVQTLDAILQTLSESE